MQKINSILSFSFFCIAAVVTFTACTAVQESSSMAFDNASQVIKHYSGKVVVTEQNNAAPVQKPTEAKVKIQEEDIAHGNSGGSSNYGAVSYQPTEVELIELGNEVKR